MYVIKNEQIQLFYFLVGTVLVTDQDFWVFAIYDRFYYKCFVLLRGLGVISYLYIGITILQPIYARSPRSPLRCISIFSRISNTSIRYLCGGSRQIIIIRVTYIPTGKPKNSQPPDLCNSIFVKKSRNHAHARLYRNNKK